MMVQCSVFHLSMQAATDTLQTLVGVQRAKPPEILNIFGSENLVLSCPGSGSSYNSELVEARPLNLERAGVQEAKPPENFDVLHSKTLILSCPGSGS